MQKKNLNFVLSFIFITTIVISLNIVTATKAEALPIDWNGCFGVDTTTIDNFRRIDGTSESSSINTLGTQEIPLADGNHKNAAFQSYIFCLNPTVVVNDAVSVKAEFTTGFGKSGRIGDNGTTSKQPNMGSALYPHNFSAGENLNITQAYLELYSDTATYQVGRHKFHWGLGAVFNEGKNVWDRYSSIRDGFTMNIQLSKFKFTPFYSKTGTDASLTKATYAKEYGFGISYDNPENDMAFGLLYNKKSTNGYNSSYDDDFTNTGASDYIRGAETKLIDLFFEKSFGKFSFALEAPIYNGKLGKLYGGADDVNYKARAFIAESAFKLNNNFDFGINAGQVSGDSGSNSEYAAMYLNPNYQIANLLFRYNLYAVSDNTKSVYDSYITNAKYFKFFTNYYTEKWKWNAAFIYATAQEVASAGGNAYNHETNKRFVAVADQADDLGYEVDFGFDYSWNSETTIGGSFGYLFTGDYYSYTNTANSNAAKNSYMGQLRIGVKF